MAPDYLPALPGDITYLYLAEGAANIVYRLCTPIVTLPCAAEERGDDELGQKDMDLRLIQRPKLLKNKLLRVRKDLPTTVPCAVSHAAWLRLIAPLFHRDQIVEQCLVELHPTDLIMRLNESLRDSERNPPLKRNSKSSLGGRPIERHGVYLANDRHGLLITDMTPNENEDKRVIEFKPKWLAQSRSAPPTSKRCRQCALAARKNARRSRKGEQPKPQFCPLDLVSKSPYDLNLVASQILTPNRDPVMNKRFAKWLETNKLLAQLRTYQEQLDQRGVLLGGVDDENLLAAMTLRDCTVFVRYLPEDDVEEFEARLGDLDLKVGEKTEYWRSIELPLIEEGWYEGLEKDEDRQLITCQLSREKEGQLGRG